VSREFTIVRELSREEIERHQRRFIGVTASTPAHVEGQTGIFEWVADVRIGFESSWYVVKKCLISQMAFGVVTDIGIPVQCERSEAGRVTIVGRSEVLLPDIVLNTYTHYELALGYMAEIQYNHTTSAWEDGFGSAKSSPTADTGWAVTAWGAERCLWE